MFCKDKFWNGSAIWPTQGYPQISRCLVHTVFSYIPATVAIIGIILALKKYKNERSFKSMKRKRYAMVHNVNIVVAFFFTVASSFSIITLEKDSSTSLVISCVLHVITSFVGFFLQVFDACQNIHMSLFLLMFWIVNLICSLPDLYSVILITTPVDIFVEVEILLKKVQFFLVMIQIITILFFQSTSDSEYFSERFKKSLVFRLLMMEKINILSAGYKNVLSFSDLHHCPTFLQCAKIHNKFNTNTSSFGFAVIRHFAWRMLLQISLAAIYLVFRFAFTAFLLGCFIDFFQNYEQNWKGIFYIAILSVVLICSSALCVYISNALYILGIQLKALVFSIVYRKLLRVSYASNKCFSSGDLINILIVDAERLVFASKFVGYGSASIVLAMVSIVLLYVYINIAALVVALCFCFIVAICSKLNQISISYQRRAIEDKNVRLKSMNEMLAGIKIIKLHAWENAVCDLIRKLRSNEDNNLKLFSKWFAAFRGLLMALPLITALVGYTVYTISSNVIAIDTKTAFVSLGLFMALRQVSFFLPEMVSQVSQTIVAFKNIKTFLDQAEVSKREIQNKFLNIDFKCVELNVASFKRNELDDRFALKNINLSGKSGQLIAIIGSIGSGKSTLLQALLGELYCVNGTLTVHGSTAFVGQLPWIQNDTVKKNILFLKQYNQKKYLSVLDKCCLVEDLQLLKNGENTFIGERGIRISGGQKQRIAIARAVYQEKDIYLFDDPLSALDPDIGLTLFRNIISKQGILKNKLRILVTNNIIVLPETDYIYVMKDGCIISSGTYDELQNALENQDTFKTYKMRTDEIDNRKYMNSENKISTSSINLDSEKESMAKGTISFETFVTYARSFGSLRFVVGILFGLFAGSTELFEAFWLSAWTKDEKFGLTTQRNLRLIIYAIGAFLVAFGNGSYYVIESVNIIKTATCFHDKMLESVLHSPLSFFDQTPTGQILNRFGNDMDQLDLRLSVVALKLFDFSIFIFLVLLLACYFIPIFCVVILIFLVAFIFFQRVTMATGRQLKRLEAITRSSVCNHILETVRGLETIRAFEATQSFRKMAEELSDNNANCIYHSRGTQIFVSLVALIVADIATIVLVVLVVFTTDRANSGNAAIIIGYATNVIYVFALLIDMMSETETAFIAAERTVEYIKLPGEATCKIKNTLVSSTWPQHGKIEFNNFSSKYKYSDKCVLKNINMRILPGEKIGIVGRTGAGKSSIVLSLFRVLEPTSGTIFIDGIDINAVELHDLRSKLTIIPQDPVLFSGTLRMNLDIRGVHSDDELWQAVRLSHMKSFVKENGLDTIVEEFGANLSVGERQLVCLARAILNKTKILVMDEATSSVDVKTDALMQDAIRSHFSNCTVLTIAHRTQTIMEYDSVVVLDAGRIVEKGNPYELARKTDSHFAKLSRLT